MSPHTCICKFLLVEKTYSDLITFQYNTLFGNLLATSCGHQNHMQDLENGIQNDYDPA